MFTKYSIAPTHLSACLVVLSGVLSAVLVLLFFSETGIQTAKASIEESTESRSVELGIINMSPNGELGGYAMPASGCGTTHTRCTATQCIGKDCVDVCIAWDTFVHQCTPPESINLNVNHNSPANNSTYNVTDTITFKADVENKGSGRFDGDDEFKLRLDVDYDRANCDNASADENFLIKTVNGAIEVDETRTWSLNQSFSEPGNHCWRYRISNITGFADPNTNNNTTGWRRFTIRQPVNGSCGTANGRTFRANDTSYGSYTACSAGNASGFAFPAAGATDNWSCNGTNGGSNASCSATRRAYPGAVTGLNYSCNSAGNQVTLSWSPTSGATGYYIRRYIDPATWGNPTCTGTNSASNLGYCNNNYNNTSITLNIPPDKLIRYWMHARDSIGSYGTSASVNFTCPSTPTPQCSDGVDNADPEDTLVDSADPGCWATPGMPGSYDPNDNDETDSGGGGSDPDAVVTLTATPNNIDEGQPGTVTLDWTIADGQNCTAASSQGNWDKSISAADGSEILNDVDTSSPTTHTYQLACSGVGTGAGDSDTASVIINNTGGGGGTPCNAPEAIAADSPLIRSGDPVTITWYAYDDANDCELLQGSTVVQTGVANVCGTEFEYVTSLDNTSTFTVQCPTDPGTPPTQPVQVIPAVDDN